jgi:type II secretion system protein N
MGWIGPGLLGVSASNVRISKKIDDPDASPPAAFLIKSVAIRPSLFPPGVAFGGSALGGSISGRMGGFGGTSIQLDFNGLNTSDPNFKEVTGVDATGKISGRLSLDMPMSTVPGPSKSKEADLSQANGALSFKLDRVVVNGGTITVPVMGQPMLVPLEKLSIGDLEARVKFEKGQGRIEKFQGKGDDLEVLASGTIKLARQVDYAESNIDLKLKFDPDAQKRLGAMAMGLTFLPADKENPEFRTAKITGFLARPNFNPGQ